MPLLQLATGDWRHDLKFSPSRRQSCCRSSWPNIGQLHFNRHTHCHRIPFALITRGDSGGGLASLLLRLLDVILACWLAVCLFVIYEKCISVGAETLLLLRLHLQLISASTFLLPVKARCRWHQLLKYAGSPSSLPRAKPLFDLHLRV